MGDQQRGFRGGRRPFRPFGGGGDGGGRRRGGPSRNDSHYSNHRQQSDEDAWEGDDSAAASSDSYYGRGRDSQNQNSRGYMSHDSSSRGGGFGRGNRGGDRDNTWRNKGGAQESSTSFMISSRDVGKVIGRGGTKIRELQDNSGARIKIGDQDHDETEVSLFGNDEATKKAKELIESFLDSYSSGNSYNGKNYGY